MSEWREVELGDVLEIDHGFAFKGEFFSDDGDDVLLTPKNFRPSGGLDTSPHRCKYYSGPVDTKYVLAAGDIVVAMTDLTQNAPILGSTGVVPAGSRYLHNQRIGKLRTTNSAVLDESFLPWLLNSPTVRARVRASATGATVRHTAPTRIREITVTLPPIALQRRISCVLDGFDELIEINERRIEVLENLARSLYREWFVYFRFPGHRHHTLVDSDAGTVPADWEVQPLSAVVAVNPKVSGKQGSYAKVVMADVDERMSFAFPSAVVNHSAGSRYLNGDVLFARITPCLENGKTALVSGLAPAEIGIGSTEFIVLRGELVGPTYTYCCARSDRIREHAIKSMSGASGRQRVASNAFDSSKMATPPPELARAFEEAAFPMLESVYELAKQNRALAATRDLLLPRLVTGRLDISEIDLGELLRSEVA